MKTKAANDNTTTPSTPLMDALTPVLAASLPAEMGWQIQGWAAHLRPAKHQNHAANSWAKHALEFGRCWREAELVVLARLADFGMSAPEAVELIRERMKARAAKAAA